MGTQALIQTQYGIEADGVRGTAVAATRVLGCAPKPVPMDRIWTGIKHGDGRRSQFSTKKTDKRFVHDSIVFDADHPLYFQALPVFHQCSLDGTITPGEVTPAQGDYKWDVTPSLTAANSPDTLTLEMGDDIEQYEIEFVMFDNLKIAGTIPQDGSDAPVTGEFSYFGRQVTVTNLTAAQALHSGLEFMSAKLATFSLDALWANVGTTPQTNTLRGFALEIVAGTEPKFYGSANRYFDSFGEGQIGALLTLDLEGNALADAIYDLYRDGTERALRFAITGSTIAAGTAYKYQVDLFGYFAEVVPLNQLVGANSLHRALFVVKPDTVSNAQMDIDIVTNNSTV